MRRLKRWISECDFVTAEGVCDFNNRTKPQLHVSFAKAEGESYQHALEAGHIGAKEVRRPRRRRSDDPLVSPRPR